MSIVTIEDISVRSSIEFHFCYPSTVKPLKGYLSDLELSFRSLVGVLWVDSLSVLPKLASTPEVQEVCRS